MVSVVYADAYERELLFPNRRETFLAFVFGQAVFAGNEGAHQTQSFDEASSRGSDYHSPLLVEAIVAALKKRVLPISPLPTAPEGFTAFPLLQGIYKASGMEKVASGQNVSLNTDVSHRDVAFPEGTVCKKFPIITPAAEADLVISVAKLKTHGMVGLSGGVKNLFGCIPGLTKPEYHWRFPKEEDFCHMLLDLCETVKPALTFVDAIVSMEGDGPSSGTKKKTGMVLCSQSPYEMDEVLCRVTGMDPKAIGTVRLARERGLFRVSLPFAAIR